MDLSEFARLKKGDVILIIDSSSWIRAGTKFEVIGPIEGDIRYSILPCKIILSPDSSCVLGEKLYLYGISSIVKYYKKVVKIQILNRLDLVDD